MKKKFLAAALASVMAVTSAAAVSAVELTDTISGDLTVTDFLSEKTDAVEMKDGESYTFEFNNKSNGTDNWHNFVLVVTSAVGADYTGAEQEILVIRSDLYAVGPSSLTDFSSWGEESTFVWTSDIPWSETFWAEEWVPAMQAGVDVKATISREGNKFTYSAKIGNYNVGFEATSGKEALPESLYVFLTGDNCTLTGITATKTPAEAEPEVPDDTKAEEPAPEVTEPEATEPEATEPEATEPEATEPEATEPEATEPEATDPVETEPAMIEVPVDPIKLGDLNVTAFFGAKTNAVEFKSGDTYTFTFNVKSNGTNNWDNFVLAIADVADTAAYPENGADHEVLVIRADSWGWGGGLSDFVAPDAADGNKLAFDTNVDWDKWLEFAKAGFDVKIDLTRNGNTITYKATMGDYYVNLTATSGKALPEDLYVFFTGENCDLKNIVATPVGKTQLVPNPNAGKPINGGSNAGNDDKDTPPNTGVAAPVAVAAVAIVSAGAMVVLKKKSK